MIAVKHNLHNYSLSKPLIGLSDKNPQFNLQINDVLRGTLILGSTGSGKTSSIGRRLALEMLKAGFGGIILCVKNERKEWENLIQYLHEKTGIDRQKDLIVFSPGSEHKFNPLQSIIQYGKAGMISFNVVSLLLNIYQIGKNISNDRDKGNSDRFWSDALRTLLTFTVELLFMADEEVSFENIYEVVSSILTEKESSDLQKMLNDYRASEKKLEDWAKRNYYIKCFLKATHNLINPNRASERFERQYFLSKNQFQRRYVKLAARTKAIIVESCLGMILPFLSGPLRDHFCNDTNLDLRLAHQGKIILVDWPVLDLLEIGSYANAIVKLLFQKLTEQRRFQIGIDPPVFLWSDEAQYTIGKHDFLFQSTARSSGVATVMLSQSVSSFLTNWTKPSIDSLLANLACKFLLCSNDPASMEYYAKLIGQDFRSIVNTGMNGASGSSTSIQKQFHWQIPPKDFSLLRCGGDENDWEVDTVVSIGGKDFNRSNYIRKTFKQIIL